MPIYEYECNECLNLFERKQNFHDEPVAMCPICQGKARRVIHSVPVIFKGSGFYVTDHRKTNSASSETPAISETPAKTETPAKSESSATTAGKEEK